MIVMIAKTTPSMATWIGMTNTSSGMTSAPDRLSLTEKLIAAHAVGGRLA
jgi:hypothetical protein